jgi:hypothetical protein
MGKARCRRSDGEVLAGARALRLAGFYRHLDEEDRHVVDSVLASWVLDGDAARRFDALALIDEFEIRSALPALQAALARLAEVGRPSTPTDRTQVRQIIGRLR